MSNDDDDDTFPTSDLHEYDDEDEGLEMSGRESARLISGGGYRLGSANENNANDPAQVNRERMWERPRETPPPLAIL
jgi:hypothetical protein